MCTQMWFRVLVTISRVVVQKLSYLTHCGLVTQYGIIYLANIGSDNGLAPGGTTPLAAPMFDL